MTKFPHSGGSSNNHGASTLGDISMGVEGQALLASSNGTCLQPKRTRRSRIPDKPNISFSLWSIMKNCIGKDLFRIPIPVNFSEPLSFLQRLNEDFEYSEILDRASDAADDYEQLALVAAFTVSSYSATAIRTG